jgi:hypothetical protein
MHSWSKTSGIPLPKQENIHINFWLMNGAAPINGNDAEVVVEKFLYCPPL